MPSIVIRPESCLYCRAPLVHPPSGRPRLVCPAPDCRRLAATEQKRRRRRAKAGMAQGARDRGRVAPLPTGGRDGVLRKQARVIAGQMAKHVTATEGELVAIETALCTTGLTARTLSVSISGSLVRGMPAALPKRVQATLRELMKRNHAARKLARQQPRGPEIVGQLPEPFSQPGRSRGAPARDNDMAWIGLPMPQPKPRIELPLPAEKPLIDLPTPKARR